jgi:hypothetical protein
MATAYRLAASPVNGYVEPMRIALVLLLAACSSAPATRQTPPQARPLTWAVSFERSIGTLSTAPVFAADGSVTSAGQRFDRAGRYLGLLPIEVAGGRMISNLRALLRDGRGLAQATDGDDFLLLGRADQPPEKAIRIPSGSFVELAVSADQTRVAAYGGGAIRIWTLARLEPAGRIEAGEGQQPDALTFLPDGGMAFSIPCRGAACTGGGLAVRGTDGRTRTLRDRGIEAYSFAPDGTAAILLAGTRLEIVALPGGQTRGRIALPGADQLSGLAVSPGGATAAALVCNQLLMWSRTGRGWTPAYRGAITGEEECTYTSGLAFSPDGESLALATRDLTVLRRGATRAPVVADYRPDLPAGFAPSDAQAIYMPPHGTGLGPAPRLLGRWVNEQEGWTQARVVAREAAEMSRFTDLDSWSNAILTRFEPMVRGDLDPNRADPDLGEVFPYRRAFIDPRGRRVLEYTLLVRGGCEEMDRHVRWIEDGEALVEIDIESVPGVAPPVMRAWLAAFTGESRKVAVADYRRGPC